VGLSARAAAIGRGTRLPVLRAVFVEGDSLFLAAEFVPAMI
jgi:hypothetical protein